MIQELSPFFQPFVRQASGTTATIDYQTQFARELLLEELEAELVEQARVYARNYQADKVKAVAHRLHNLVLRHTTPADWSRWLNHEIKRKSGDAKKLLEYSEGLLTTQDNDVINRAITDAAQRAERYRVGSSDLFPLRDAALAEFSTQIRDAALRFYLAHLLERLTL